MPAHTIRGALLSLAVIACACSSRSISEPQPVQTATQLSFSFVADSQVAGVLLSPAIQVTIEDASGNPVTSATNSVTVAIGLNAAGGALTGTTTVSSVEGRAVFPTLMLSKPGFYSLSATSAGLTGASSNSFSVIPHAAAAAAMRRR